MSKGIASIVSFRALPSMYHLCKTGRVSLIMTSMCNDGIGRFRLSF